MSVEPTTPLSSPNKRWVLMGIMGVFLLVIGAVTFAKRDSIRLLLEERRASQQIEEAIAASREGDVKTARRLALSAHQLSPRRVAPLRVLLSANTNPPTPNVIMIAGILFAHPEASLEDRLRCLEAYLELKDFRLFRLSLNSLPKAEKTHPDVRFLEATYFALLGDPGQAIRLLDSGPKNDSRYRFLRSSLLSVSRDEGRRRVGQLELAQWMSSSDSETADRAFRKMQSIPVKLREVQILKPMAEQWAQRQRKEDIRLDDQLALAALEWLSQADHSEEEQASIVEDVISKYGSDFPIKISSWLVSLEEWDSALGVVEAAEASRENEPEDAEQSMMLYQIRLMALQGSMRWEALLEALDSAPSQYSPIRLALARSLTQKRLGNEADASSQWSQAWQYAELASSKRNAFIDLYQWANSNDEPDYAVEAIVEASQHEMGILPSTDELTQIMFFLTDEARSDELVRFTDGLLKREYLSNAIVNNAIYFRELAGRPHPRALELSQMVCEQSPQVMGFQNTLVLLLLNRGHHAEALQIAKSIMSQSTIRDLPVADLAILAGAFRVAGVSSGIDDDFLGEGVESLPSGEKRYFERWLDEVAIDSRSVD